MAPPKFAPDANHRKAQSVEEPPTVDEPHVAAVSPGQPSPATPSKGHAAATPKRPVKSTKHKKGETKNGKLEPRKLHERKLDASAVPGGVHTSSNPRGAANRTAKGKTPRPTRQQLEAMATASIEEGLAERAKRRQQMHTHAQADGAAAAAGGWPPDTDGGALPSLPGSSSTDGHQKPAAAVGRHSPSHQRAPSAINGRASPHGSCGHGYAHGYASLLDAPAPSSAASVASSSSGMAGAHAIAPQRPVWPSAAAEALDEVSAVVAASHHMVGAPASTSSMESGLESQAGSQVDSQVESQPRSQVGSSVESRSGASTSQRAMDGVAAADEGGEPGGHGDGSRSRSLAPASYGGGGGPIGAEAKGGASVQAEARVEAEAEAEVEVKTAAAYAPAAAPAGAPTPFRCWVQVGLPRPWRGHEEAAATAMETRRVG